MKGMSNSLTRRGMLAGTAAGLAAAAMPTAHTTALAATQDNAEGPVIVNKRIRQSVCMWCFGGVSLERMCVEAKRMGYESIELLNEPEIRKVKEHGLTCAIVNSHGINNGLNRTENHEQCLEAIRKAIDIAVKYECPNVITFSGNRGGMPDDVGLANCAEALAKITPYAEEKQVTIIMELLNSKVDHKDYMFDNIAWGVELCKRVKSDRFKLLYDIYHAQVNEGDVIRSIRNYHQYIGHYHTAGNPGRNEIDDTQELYYPAIMREIVKTGYTGFVGQEFLPRRDALKSLAEAAKICDV